MNKYLITYDLKTEGKDYTSLFNTIKSLGSWWHYLTSTWIVRSLLPAEDIAARLNPNISPDKDRLLVVKIDETDYQGWLTKDAWQWLNTKS